MIGSIFHPTTVLTTRSDEVVESKLFLLKGNAYRYVTEMNRVAADLGRYDYHFRVVVGDATRDL